jgi:hypothetical protein
MSEETEHESAEEAALKAVIEKDEDQRTEEDWELLAKALESDKHHLEEAAHEVGHDLTE